MIVVNVVERAGEFAENKDTARSIREEVIAPALIRGESVVVDFDGVHLTTQSFVHAMLSDLIRRMGPEVFDVIEFRNCNDVVQSLVEIVAEYSQDSGLA